MLQLLLCVYPLELDKLILLMRELSLHHLLLSFESVDDLFSLLVAQPSLLLQLTYAVLIAHLKLLSYLLFDDTLIYAHLGSGWPVCLFSSPIPDLGVIFFEVSLL